MNATFVVKEGTNNKNLDIILFAYSRGLEDLCFVAVDPRIRKLWAFVYVTLNPSYVIDFSSRIFPLYAVKKGDKRTNVPNK